ncbi:MAG: alternative ribosome rescue aminoacyl-tRNA hydrolase ArfB [Acidimicrobiia bacterium]|nr:alternative ribosome rescue aminoacyl-tRNA hydrolase ArfB [Acidimicrobiia bacterium]
MEGALSFNIPDRELQWRFSPTGGPGGQHANKTSTRVELRFDVETSSAIDERSRARIVSKVGPEIRIVEDRSRSQATNRKRALRRLEAILDGAAKPDPPSRRSTKPSRSARKKRVDEKRKRSQTKLLRKPPSPLE